MPRPRRPRRRRPRRATPGSDASACATAAGGPSTRTTTRSAPSRRAARAAGVSSATSLPADMITMRVQSAARLREDVRREQDGPAREPAQQVPHLHGLHGIEADGRLVEHEDGRIAEQRLRQRRRAGGSPSTASRSDAPPPSPRPQLAMTVVDGTPRAPPVEPLHPGHEAQVAPHAELRIQGHLLGQVADLAAAPPRGAPRRRRRPPGRDRRSARRSRSGNASACSCPSRSVPRSAATSPRAIAKDTSSTARTGP